MRTLPAVGFQFTNIRSTFTCFEGLFNSKSMPLFNSDCLMYYYLASLQHFFIQACWVITLDFISVIKYQLPAEIFESTYTCFHLASYSDCKTVLLNYKQQQIFMALNWMISKMKWPEVLVCPRWNFLKGVRVFPCMGVMSHNLWCLIKKDLLKEISKGHSFRKP